MAMADVPEFSLLPTGWGANTIGAGITPTNPKRAMLINAPKTGVITHIGAPFGSVSTNSNVKLSLQTVLTSGLEYIPSGTLVTGTSYSSIFSPAINSFYWQPIGNGAVTVGDLLAPCIEFDTTSGNMNLQYIAVGRGYSQGMAYVASSSTWSKSTGGALAIRYSDGSEYGVGSPIASSLTQSFQNTSSTNERGNRFRLAFDARLSGWWYFGQAATGVPFDLNVYNEANTLLFSRSYNSNMVTGSAQFNRFAFDATLSLSAGTWYRIAVKNSSTIGNWNCREHFLPDVAIAQNMDGGSDFYSTARGSSGIWTDTPNSKHTIAPMFNGIDVGNSGPTSSGSIFNSSVISAGGRTT